MLLFNVHVVGMVTSRYTKSGIRRFTCSTFTIQRKIGQINLAATSSRGREHFRDSPVDFDFRPVGKVFMAEYAKFIASRNAYLGSKGQLDGCREHAKKALGL